MACGKKVQNSFNKGKMNTTRFKELIQEGIPEQLPQKKSYPLNGNPAPKRKDILSLDEKKLAIKNALRYFPKAWHQELAVEFAHELKAYVRIYMHRFKPSYKIYARAIAVSYTHLTLPTKA